MLNGMEVDAIGEFFEATGRAFQIIDDVLNLRGLVKPGEKMSQVSGSTRSFEASAGLS